MEKLVFENPESEEMLVYYYVHHSDMALNDFVNEVNTLEKLCIEPHIKPKIIEQVDLEDLISHTDLENQKILEIQSFFDDWNYKVFLITLEDYFVIRIFETYA